MNAVSRTNAMWSPLADELRREAQRAGHLARSALGAPGAGVFLLVAVALGVAYPLYTGHIWEDFFISFRHAANLAEGHGLVYNLGERVQGFSSPIGVLLASFFHFITGRGSYGPALWLYRIAGILAFALAGVCLLHLTRRHERALQLAPFCFVVLFLLDFKALAFSTNGMETAWMLFFLALSLYALCADTDVNWVMGGLGWAGLMWTRPDSCVYIAVLGVGSLIFRRTTARRHLSALVKMAGVCTVLYLPWFVGAWTITGLPFPRRSSPSPACCLVCRSRTFRASSTPGSTWRSVRCMRGSAAGQSGYWGPCVRSDGFALSTGCFRRLVYRPVLDTGLRRPAAVRLAGLDRRVIPELLEPPGRGAPRTRSLRRVPP